MEGRRKLMNLLKSIKGEEGYVDNYWMCHWCICYQNANSRFTIEGSITPQKSLEIPIRNLKSRTPETKIPLKNEKSPTLNVEVTHPSLLNFLQLSFDSLRIV